MDTTAPSLPALPAPKTSFGALPMNKKLMMIGGAAALAAIIVVAAMWSRTPEQKVLFSNLSDRDGGAVVAAGGPGTLSCGAPQARRDGG
jgi:flagellar M-ring protein FliF